MSDAEEFMAWTQSELRGAETALHDRDSGPRLALWSERSRSQLLTGFGQEEVRQLFKTLAATFSGCTTHVYEIRLHR